MLLYVPESWVRQVEILKELGGSDMTKVITDNIKPIVVRAPREEKVEEVKAEEMATDYVPNFVMHDSAEEKVEEVKAEEVVDTKVEEEVKAEEVVDAKVEEEVKAEGPMLKPSDDNIITMKNRKTCPVQVVPKKKAAYRVQVGHAPVMEKPAEEEKFDESLEAFKAKLVEYSINFIDIRRAPTGLIEVVVMNAYNQPLLLSVDWDDIIFGLGTPVFFVGPINPTDEYITRPFILNDKSLMAVINNVPMDQKYHVSDDTLRAAMVLDTASIHEHNAEKKRAVLEKANKAILSVWDEIKKNVGNEPVRFSFVRYKSIDDFAIVSSKKSRVSNLTDQTLLATKKLRIEVKEKDVQMTIK